LVTACSALGKHPPYLGITCLEQTTDKHHRGSGTDCTKSQVGYSPIDVISEYTGNSYSGASATTAKGLTRVQVLHPVGCGLAFLAFFTALGSSIVGSLVASLLAAGAFLITLIVTITDFVSWGIVKNQVNDRNDGNRATFEVAIWLVLVAMILLFFASFAVLFSCFSKRRKDRRTRRGHASKHDTAYGTPVRRKRHFWQRRERVARY